MGRSRSPWLFSADRDPNVAHNHWASGLPLEWMTQLVSDGDDLTGVGGRVGMFDHFMTWVGPAAEGGPTGGWILSGTTGTATVVLTNVRGGEIVLTSDSTSGANPTLQYGSTLGANFLYVAPTTGNYTPEIWCFTRVKLLTVASMEFFFGLATPDTAPCTSDTLPSDGIFFWKASSDTKLSFDVRKDGTSTSKANITSTLVDATYFTVGFRVMRTGTVVPYFNGVALVSSAIAAGTANLPVAGDVLQLETGFKGASMTATYDWMLACQQRTSGNVL